MSEILFGIAAIILGIAGSYGIFWLLDRGVRFLPEKAQEKLRVFSFITPAAALLVLVSVIPLFVTVIQSFMDKKGTSFIGMKNYTELFSSQTFLGILLNNFLWVAFVPAITVASGLIFATLTNGVGRYRERIFKSLIFMPMSISFVSAATIWAFAYDYPPPGRPKTGLVNAVIEALGGTAVPLLATDTWRLNSFLLMIIVIWLNAGFSMMLLSAAIKAVPEETIEAARIDGAGGLAIFFKVIIPQIRGTIVSVLITVIIGTMKIFDIVLAMTGGNFNTSVLGFEYYRQYFVDTNVGAAAAVITVLCVLIAPLMWLQVRTVRHQQEMA
jgi:alpha-glucoside transport system permease protein